MKYDWKVSTFYKISTPVKRNDNHKITGLPERNAEIGIQKFILPFLYIRPKYVKNRDC